MYLEQGTEKLMISYRLRAKSTDRNKLTANKLTVSQQFRHSDFITKWGFGQDGSWDKKIFLCMLFSANRRH